jgi:hypothetical protein
VQKIGQAIKKLIPGFIHSRKETDVNMVHVDHLRLQITFNRVRNKILIKAIYVPLDPDALLGQEFEQILLEQEYPYIPYAELNEDQKAAFQNIITAIENNTSVIFFVDGSDGTGKTFL